MAAASKNKTVQTRASVGEFLAGIKDPARRKDSRTLVKLMREVSKFPPRMWGSAIVGFGIEHYQYASGREGEMPLIGFSPRKGSLVIYGTARAAVGDATLMARLGKHSRGKGCLYVKKLEDVHGPTLKKLLQRSVKLKSK